MLQRQIDSVALYRHHINPPVLHSTRCAHKAQPSARSPSCASNHQPGCSTLSHQQHPGDEDCQWPEPVTDGRQHEPSVGIVTSTSSNGSSAGQHVQTTYQNVSTSTPYCEAIDDLATSSSNCCSASNDSSISSTNSQDGSLQQSGSSSSSQPHQQQQQQQPWPPDVPWGLNKAAQVMGLWLLAYFATGQLLVPTALAFLDLDQSHLSARGSAVLNLALDILQVGITVGILARCLKKYQPLKNNLFPISWQKGQWLGPVAAGATVFPVVDWLVHSSHQWSQLGMEQLQPQPDMWTAQIEAGLYNQDWLSCTAYVLVVVVFAPIWEEAIFRGFLLRTLMKPFAVPAAVLGSALMFAVCHFNQDTFAPLVLLGVVFGWLYAKCNNLLPPMILHSLWNTYVLGTLVLRMRTGYDAVTCSIIMAVGTQVVLLLCGLVLMLQQQQRISDQSQAPAVQTSN